MENAKPQRAYAQKNTELCLRLANAVERQPIIYTKSSRNYKNRNLQNDAWSCVATEVGTTIVEAKRLWTNMLCSFRSYRSKVRQSMHAGTVFRPRWFAYEAMMFMANATEDNDHADTASNITDMDNVGCFAISRLVSLKFFIKRYDRIA
ncbi:uncharacterized protein LOC118506653 [Anopheles stephensi]|uniref:uncharacterized protein LOC118506653 n=1 Tax=Anopheles stephensi TaxID=30069 RepID=UPI001658A489|nr:uncharacterized protein LOC118506653 [Anopheles stephensi]